MALILPFLLILVVGIVEAGVVLNRQLTVVNAAREGARFGATGAVAPDIYTATLDATSQMFEFTEDNAVVVVIHAKTNEAGDGFEEWLEQIYPEGSTVPHVTPDEVLEKLQAEGNAGDVKLVAVDVEYDHQSMLGLPFVGALAGEIPVGSWTVMRLETPGVRSVGCCVYPIALDVETVNWPAGLRRNGAMDDIRIGDGPGMFGWLYWDPDSQGSATNLRDNLRDACNSLTQFRNACYPEDTTLNSGDWITGDSGESVASHVRGEIEDLVGHHIRIPVWDQFEACNDMPGWCQCNPGAQVVHIVGFAIVKVTEESLTSNPKTISAEFIEFDDSCDAE
jgi:hypothetical protein